MGIEFEFFKAGHGDSILVATSNGTNILIDGGEEGTYGEEIEDSLDERNIEKLDLVVLTHIDSDHIGGIIEMLEEEDNHDRIEELWFNDSTVKINVKNGEIGYRQGNKLEKIIKDTPIKHNSNIFLKKGCSKRDREYHIGSDIKLTLLSPMKNTLCTQVKKWQEYNGEIAGLSCIDKRDLNKVAESFKEENLNKSKTKKLSKATNTSLANKTSIAFILEYNQKQFLFLGDADIKTINQSLVDLNYSSENRLGVEFVKLSHHGSKQNINENFLDLVDTSKFIILTDCSTFAHPDKETLALIATYNREKRKDVDFIFNYSELIRKKISADEKVEYDFNAYLFENNILEVE
jgi:beta-lactamase superfamily II metal-dependent hydrolase